MVEGFVQENELISSFQNLFMLSSFPKLFVIMKEKACWKGIFNSGLATFFNSDLHAHRLKHNLTCFNLFTPQLYHGIKELEHDRFISYLANRRKFCRFNVVSSKVEEIYCALPQGSCLGLLLFLIYSDDTTISYSSKSFAELNTKLKCDLHFLEEWLHGKRLTINVTKTPAMNLRSRPNLKKITRNASGAPCFVIGDTNIDIAQSAKYLGVKLDQHLVWDEQISL